MLLSPVVKPLGHPPCREFSAGDHVQLPCIPHAAQASLVLKSIHLKSATGPGRLAGDWTFWGLSVSTPAFIRQLTALTTASPA